MKFIYSLRTVVAAFATLATVISAFAAPLSPNKDTRIFIVKSKNLPPYNEAVTGLQRQLDADIPNKSVFTGELDNPAFLDFIKTGAPDLIVTVGTNATAECKKLFPDVPLVFTMILDTASSGILEGGKTDITGVTLAIPVRKQFRVIRKIFPKAKVIGVLYDKNTRTRRIAHIREVAEAEGLVIEAEPIEHPKDIPSALDSIVARADVLWAEVDAMVYTPQTAKQIILKTFRNKMPFFAYSDLYVKAGALMTLACTYEDIGEQTGNIIRQILVDGRRPADIEPQQPDNPRLIINHRTAQTIEIDIPVRISKTAYKIYGE